MRVTGNGGKLTVGGRVAAELGAWHFKGESTSWRVEATCLSIDNFWMEHGEVKRLTLSVGAGEWCWPEVAVELEGNQVIVTGSGRPGK